MVDAGGEESLVRLGPQEVSNAAVEVLSSTERRRRGRPPAGAGESAAERERKRRAGVAATINVNAAKRSAAALTKESPSYRKLIEMQQQLDLFLMRKQQDIKDALHNHVYTTPRVFRLFLFNTYRGQVKGRDKDEDSDVVDGMKGDGDSERKKDGIEGDSVPSWTLRIQGKLLPPSTDNSIGAGPVVGAAASAGGGGPMSVQTDAGESVSMANGSGIASGVQGAGGQPDGGFVDDSKVRCSHIFKRIVIELDKDLYPENNFIEWNRNKGEVDCDGFEITRPGKEESTVKIYLFVDHKPERFKLSHQLSQLLGLPQDTRSGVFMGVWQYIKREKLQCVDDRTSIRLDDGLRLLMSEAQAARGVMKLQLLYRIVKMHLGPVDPIQLEYDIKLSGDPIASQACYDIQVQLEDTSLIESAKAAGVFGDSLPSSAEFSALNEKHLDALEQLALHKRRRDFFECFSAGPVDFINQLVLSQTRDLKVIGGATGRNPEEERRASFYHQQWIHEAIPRYLLRKAISDAAKRTSQAIPK